MSLRRLLSAACVAALASLALSSPVRADASAAAPLVPNATASDSSGNPVWVSTLRIHDEVIGYKGSNYLRVTIGFSTTSDSYSIVGATTSVSVNGKKVGTVNLTSSSHYYPYSSYWGVGKVQLGPTTISYWYQGAEASVTDTTLSNAARTRMNTRGDFHIKRSGHHYRFSLYGVNFSQDHWVSARSAQIQYRSGGKWVALTTVKLDARGNGTYARRFASQHTWRAVIAKTDTVQGAASAALAA